MNEPERQQTVLSQSDVIRVLVFLGIQGAFLFMSLFTGRFYTRVWSHLDSVLLLLSMGMTGMWFGLESEKRRKLVFRAALLFYVLAVLDMCLNIVL